MSTPYASTPYGRVVRALRLRERDAYDARLLFTIPGPPVSWARTNRVGSRQVTDAKQRDRKRVVQHAATYALAGTAWPLDGAFAIEVVSYYATAVTGDVDRSAGLLLDGCEGVLWHTDRQVRTLVSRIIADGSTPRVEVVVTRLASDPVQSVSKTRAQPRRARMR